MALHISVLGPLRVAVDGQARRVGGATQRSVLGLLTCAAGRAVTVDRLSDAVWGGDPPANPTHALQSHVSRIRAILRPDPCAVISSTAAGYRLDLPAGSLDADVFTAHADAAQAALVAGDMVAAAASAERGLGLWTATPYQDVRESPLVRAEVIRLEELHLRLHEIQGQAGLALGCGADLVPGLAHLVEAHPYRESLWVLLARALDDSGRTHEALACLRRLRALLQDELGADPGVESQRLYDAILRRGDRASGGTTPSLPEGPSLDLPAPLAMTRRGPLAGRLDATAALLSAWSTATHLTVVLVSGEAGIGKTRLAAEVGQRVAELGGSVLYGGCTRDPGVAYEPFIDALGELPPAQSALGPGALLADAAARRRQIARFIGDRLHEDNSRGTLLVLDDLHWSDTASLDILRHLAQRPPSGRVLVLATWRDTDLDRDHPLVATIADLRRLGVDHVPLEGLAVADVAELLSASGPDSPSGHTRLATRLRDASGGNPYFVMAIIDQLGHEGIGPDTMLPLPDQVRDVVMARLATLAVEDATMLAAAAVLDPDVDVATVGAVVTASVDDVILAFDRAVARGLLHEAGVGRYRFSHDIVRDVVLRGQSQSRLARWHLAMALALEAQGATAADVAHHLVRGAHDPATRARAVRASVAAGHATLDAAAPSDALLHFRTALELATDLPDELALARQARMGLGIAQRDMGDPAFRQTLLDVAAAAVEAGDHPVLVSAALENHRGMWSSLAGVDHDRIAVLDQATQHCRSDADQARLLARTAVESVFAPDRDAHAILAQALELSARIDDQTVLAEVQFAQVTAGWEPATAAHLHQVSARLVAVTQGRSNPVAHANALMWHSVHLRTAGQTQSARAALDRARQIAEDLDHDTLRLYGSGYGCAQAMLEGDVRAATDAMQATLHLGQVTGQPDVGNWYVSMLAVLLCQRGRLAELFPMILERWATRDELTELGPFRATVALALADAGRVDEAARLWGDTADALPDTRRDFIWLQTAAALAMAAHEVGDADRAARLHQLVQPHAPQFINGGVVMWGALDHTLGILASVAGDAAAAVRAFDRAERVQEDAGSDLWQVHTYLARARHMQSVDGDPVRIAELLRTASSRAEALGCPALVEQAVRLEPAR